MADSSNEEYNRDAGDYNEAGDSSSNVEWRSCEQVENGTPSTSPFWDTDTDEEGQKPAELYGKHTWKIENFSKISKRELRSDPFDAGGYKWYILIYPQGCDVHNHISLFLCVANHDKLLPGWSHFAQFTIAVVNKDPKKSKYSDTLHRFWKKEHDWGWKKFMELSKVQDGFLADGVLVIKAQVQVIREKSDRPFRCLDRLYRRELVRIYMTNIENIYRRFVEEKRNRLSKLIDDKSRWSSFHAFWRSTSPAGRCAMSREKSDTILKQIIKHFFIEKEVTSTLVMDSLYSGLRALELQGGAKGRKGGSEAPVVRVDRDLFVLADDVVLLLERAVLVGEVAATGKDDDGRVSQNRTTKDGTTIEEMSRDTIERDERRLTEIGRRILEIFTLAHIYSTIEVAYQEAVALKRQEELIREEEEAWMNEPDSKSKRDNKDKKSKKKQGKQKKNNKKGKEKEKEEKPEENENLTEDLNEDISENGEDASNGEVESADLEVQENNNPVTEQEVIMKDEWTGKKNYVVSSSANDDWVPVGSTNKNSSSYKNQTSPNRGKAQRSKNEKPIPLPVVITNISEKVGPTHVVTRVFNEQTGPSLVANSSATPGGSGDSIVSSASSNGSRAPTPQPKQKIEQHIIETVQKKPEIKPQPQPQINSPSKPATPKAAPVSSTPNPPEKPSPTLIRPSVFFKSPSSATSPNSAAFGAVRPAPPSIPTNPTPSRPAIPTVLPFVPVYPPPSPKPEPVKTVPKPVTLTKPESVSRIEPINPVKNNNTSPRAVVSRPLSAPTLPPVAPRPATSMPTQVQASPYLARSVSSVSGWVGTDPVPSPTAPSFVPQSYRNAITGSNGSNITNPLTGLTGPHPHPNPIGFATQSALLTARLNADASESNLSFFSSSPGGWNGQKDNGSDILKPDLRTIAEEFPHMDMINGLFEDAELSWPHDTARAPYRNFPRSGSGRVDPLRDMGLSNGSGRNDPLRDMGLSNGPGRVDPLGDVGLANGSGWYDPLMDMGLSSGSSRVDSLRDMGLTGGLGRVDPLRDMGLSSGSVRIDPLRDMGLSNGSVRIDPLRDMGLSNGSGRIDPLYDMGVLNSRVYGSSSGSGLRDVGNNSVYNNVPSYHLNNGHYDYASDLGMNLNLNLNLGSDLSNGYGIGDYSNLQNRFRYPYDNGR